MSALALLAILLTSPAAAQTGAEPPATRSDAQSPALDQVRQRLEWAFETGQALAPEIAQELSRLEAAPAPPPEASSQPGDSRRRAQELETVLAEIRSLQAGPPKAASAPGPAGLDRLPERVARVCDALGIREEPRRAAALALYRARWSGGRRNLTPQGLAEENKQAAESLKRSRAAEDGARARATRLLNPDVFGKSPRPETLETGLAAGASPSGRSRCPSARASSATASIAAGRLTRPKKG